MFGHKKEHIFFSSFGLFAFNLLDSRNLFCFVVSLLCFGFSYSLLAMVTLDSSYLVHVCPFFCFGRGLHYSTAQKHLQYLNLDFSQRYIHK